jgi:hypothetical protein
MVCYARGDMRKAISTILATGLLLGGCKEPDIAWNPEIAWDCGGTVIGFADADSGFESGTGGGNDSDLTVWVVNPPPGSLVLKIHTTAHAFSTWHAELNGEPCTRKPLAQP